MIEVDLKPFCGSDHYHRGRLGGPWSLGAWTYASNGHIAIRVPRRADVPENPEAPENIKDLFERFVGESFRPLTARVPSADLPPCRDCLGAGWVVKCPACDGEGGHDCNCEYCDHHCDGCDGSGFRPGAADTPQEKRMACDECDGTGRGPDTRRVHFPGGLVLHAKYVVMLQDLPGPIEMGAGGGKGPQSFRGDGWTALISPLSYADMREGDVVLTDEALPSHA